MKSIININGQLIISRDLAKTMGNFYPVECVIGSICVGF